MPRPSPVDPSSSSVDDDPLGAFDVGELRIRKPPPAWTTAAIVSSVLAWGGLAVHNLRALPRFDGVPPVSFDRVRASAKFIPRCVNAREGVESDVTAGRAIGRRRSALFALRVGTFLFGIFFVGYHMIYEERKKHTDGMEYLSDWTILLLFATEGALGLSMYRTEREEGDLNGLANALTIAYATTWTMNLVASAGAWFSFFAYPMCATLEGVDDYPKCYLEWYRLTEHVANIVVLFLEFLCGAMPIRRRDFGWPILFMEAYVLFTEMNKWRSVSMLAVPACAGFGVYTLANVEHTHNEHPKYSYLRIRNREQFPWGGDLGLFEYPSKEH
ncbi:hypothetical protein BE221DRAFT_117512 [Ostreococcus tauri]|uniref:Uncharacterized protein n=1 Tax=Ostreococcus tauri TaxID=70448 RepID=A0A1Y5I4E1_OSTTA|nr:hypothetical protein BE221DRAFT_117512 [Ostreococcus tauri]